jgi:hypothetical protein
MNVILLAIAFVDAGVDAITIVLRTVPTAAVATHAISDGVGETGTEATPAAVVTCAPLKVYWLVLVNTPAAVVTDAPLSVGCGMNEAAAVAT